MREDIYRDSYYSKELRSVLVITNNGVPLKDYGVTARGRSIAGSDLKEAQKKVNKELLVDFPNMSLKVG